MVLRYFRCCFSGSTRYSCSEDSGEDVSCLSESLSESNTNIVQVSLVDIQESLRSDGSRNDTGIPEHDLVLPPATAANVELEERKSVSVRQDQNMEKVVVTSVARMKKKKDGFKYVNGYRVLSDLGRGTFGKVKLVYDEEQSMYFAMKVINRALLLRKRSFAHGKVVNMYTQIEEEVSIMKRLSHPNINRLREVIDDDSCDFLFLVLDFASNGSLMGPNATMNPVPINTARRYFRDLINGLCYLHTMGIVHRDIKPENLLLTADDTLEIGDFGVALDFKANRDHLRQSVGTAAFLSPELCSVEKESYPPTAPDIWAAGVCLWMFLFGECPFAEATIPMTFERILGDPVQAPLDLDDQLRHLLHSVLEKDPNQRITVDQIKQHPWFKGITADRVSV